MAAAARRGSGGGAGSPAVPLLAADPGLLLRAAAFLGGADALRSAVACREALEVFRGAAELDFYTPLVADQLVPPEGLLSVGQYRCVGLRVGPGALTAAGGVELVAAVAGRWLRALDLSHCVQLQSVAALAACMQLERLSLSYCVALQSLRGLTPTSLSRLEVLSLDHCNKLADVTVLAGCQALRVAALSCCASLAWSSFPALRVSQLVAAGSRTTSCLPFAPCQGLLDLNLSASYELTTVEALSQCVALQRLNLSSCGRLEHLRGLEGHPALAWLSLNTCMKLRGLEPLGSCGALHTLNLNRCIRVDSVAPLLGCTALRIVSLHNAKVREGLDALVRAGCFVSQSPQESTPPGSMPSVAEAAAAARRAAAPAGVEEAVPGGSQMQRALARVCERYPEDWHLGLFWEASHGLCRLVGAHFPSLPDAASSELHVFVAACQMCEFAPYVGAPGRALANGSDWIQDVQLLDPTSFPRLNPARQAQFHSTLAVAVPGGVAEFLSHWVLPESRRSEWLRSVAAEFGSGISLQE